MLPGSSDREEDFDVLGPISWPVESYSPMGARVSSSTQGTLLVLRCIRCIVINAFLGMTRIASVYGMCIQWRLYEVARDLAVEGFLGNWAKFILLDIPSLSFVCGELPQISSSI